MRLAIFTGKSIPSPTVSRLLERAGHDFEWFAVQDAAELRVRPDRYDLALCIGAFDNERGRCLQRLQDSLPSTLPFLVTTVDSLSGLLSRLGHGRVKPIRITAVDCRITEAVAADSNIIWCPPYRLDAAKCRAWINEYEVPLTPREFELALYFFTHPNETVDRERLLNEIWGYGDSVRTRTLDTHVSRLRSKMELNDQHGWLLRSVYQRGYRLECPGPEGCPSGALASESCS